MKFSAVLLATVFGSAAAFAPASSQPAASVALRAATLEAPSEADEEVVATPQESTAAATAMNVEKDWPIDPASNFVKDSDRILP